MGVTIRHLTQLLHQVEAKRHGIHPFCITIDSEVRDYLPHLYGAVNWTLVEDVKKLPLKVSDIYRQLTA